MSSHLVFQMEIDRKGSPKKLISTYDGSLWDSWTINLGLSRNPPPTRGTRNRVLPQDFTREAQDNSTAGRAAR
jgi:hypothetical protein